MQISGPIYVSSTGEVKLKSTEIVCVHDIDFTLEKIKLLESTSLRSLITLEVEKHRRFKKNK